MSLNIPTHVENRRLLRAAAGDISLSAWERQHIHDCETCQAVFKVFLNQLFDVLPPPRRNEPAA